MSFRSICQMAKDNNGILSFIDFSKLNLLSLKLKEKLGKSTKDVERCQFLKWKVSRHSSINRTLVIANYRVKIGQLLIFWTTFRGLLATSINCGLTLVTMNEPEYGKFTTVPPVKEGISN